MNPEWIKALAGGILIGLAVSLMLLWNGRVTGISGILFGLLNPTKGEIGWRTSFIFGLIGAGLFMNFIYPETFAGALLTSDYTVIAAGLLVGFGTTLGSGCTSGHGVCGISRLSIRSILATCLFVGAGVVSVAVFRKIGLLL